MPSLTRHRNQSTGCSIHSNRPLWDKDPQTDNHLLDVAISHVSNERQEEDDEPSSISSTTAKCEIDSISI